MLKLFQKEQRDKIRRLLSIMLPIIGTQIAIIGMYFLMPVCRGRRVMWI